MHKDNYLERLRKNPRPVVVDFWAPWCGPCRAIGPRIEQLGEDYAGRVDVWKINADEQPALLQALSIYGIPTLIAYHKGREVTRRTGAGSTAALTGLFEAALAGVKPAATGPAPFQRLLRVGVGILLVGLAAMSGFSGGYLVLAGLGAVVLFSAVYDRCPIYRMVSTRLAEIIRRGSGRQTES